MTLLSSNKGLNNGLNKNTFLVKSALLSAAFIGGILLTSGAFAASAPKEVQVSGATGQELSIALSELNLNQTRVVCIGELADQYGSVIPETASCGASADELKANAATAETRLKSARLMRTLGSISEHGSLAANQPRSLKHGDARTQPGYGSEKIRKIDYDHGTVWFTVKNVRCQGLHCQILFK